MDIKKDVYWAIIIVLLFTLIVLQKLVIPANADSWTAMLFFATVVLVGVAWSELNTLNKSTKANFWLKLDKRFFTPEMNEIFTLLRYGVLKFKVATVKKKGDYPYFEIEENQIKKLKIPILQRERIVRKKYFAPEEIDDYLLGILEDASRMVEKGLITLDEIDHAFSWYIEQTCKNPAIQEYVKHIRQYYNDETLYEQLEKMYKQLENTNSL